MKTSDIIKHRLINQQIAGTKFKKPEEIVNWMVAMQAQEYAFAKWAIGLRLPGSTDAVIENAFNDGAILRTHLLRPTWHFVTPSDIRWLVSLSATRLNATLASYNRKLELDKKIFKRSNDIIEKLLQGGKQLTRNTIRLALNRAKINTDDTRLAHLLFDAELKGIICSGPREGKQFTYMLLEERVPFFKIPPRDESIAELARRYFASRGPATLHDFSWWSGLTIGEARAGISMLASGLEKEVIDKKEYFFVPAKSKPKGDLQNTFLMPDYDEYGISYRDRTALFNSKNTSTKVDGNFIFSHMIVIDGVIGGTWNRIIKNNKAIVETKLYNKPGAATQKLITTAVKRYTSFMEGQDVKTKK